MKTAISIPDPIFQAAEGLAHRLGISRSQLYAKAVAEYMNAHKNQNVTEKLDEIYQDETSSLNDEMHSMQLESLPKEKW